MQVNINRQLLGAEDLLWGTGTASQIRNGVQATVTKINAGNLPFDEIGSLKEALLVRYPAVLYVQSNLTATNINNIAAVVDQVVPNMAEILLADNNAVIATTKASEASVSAAAALVNRNVTDADVVLTHADVVTSTYQANLAITASNSSQASAIITNAYANINWAGFRYVDGELLVDYFNTTTSTPSLVNGELILTW